MLYTGIDLHKRSSYFTTVDEHGKVIKQMKIYNDPLRILNYFQNINDQQKAVCECTIGWYWLVDLLKENNIQISIAHAKMLKAIAFAKVKTDKIDSFILAQLLRMDFIPEAYVLNPELRAKRDLMRSRLMLVQKRINCINSVHRLLEKFNLSDPNELPELYQLQYRNLDQQVSLLEKQIKTLEKTLRKLIIFDEDLQRILWLPGIGEVHGFSILLEIADIKRFPTEKNFFSYARLVPGARNSAGKTKHAYRKAGNKYLKIAFNNAAMDAICLYPEIRKQYHSLSRKKGKHIARTLIAKELARIVYHLMYKKADYDFTFKGKELSRKKTRRWPCSANPRNFMAEAG
jgi:transposase